MIKIIILGIDDDSQVIRMSPINFRIRYPLNGGLSDNNKERMTADYSEQYRVWRVTPTDTFKITFIVIKM